MLASRLEWKLAIATAFAKASPFIAAQYRGGGLTKVGSDNLLMINAHVAHDCTLGDRCISANNATLAGHVSLDDFVIIGGMTAVHQFCIIGAHVMVGGCSGVAQDVPPFVIARGNHATPFGVNIEGLKRRGF